MSLWFWGWVIVAASVGAASALARDRFSAPFAAGATAAAVLEAAHVAPSAQWIAFATLSSALFLVVGRRRTRYTPRHRRNALGRHSIGQAAQHE